MLQGTAWIAWQGYENGTGGLRETVLLQRDDCEKKGLILTSVETEGLVKQLSARLHLNYSSSLSTKKPSMLFALPLSSPMLFHSLTQSSHPHITNQSYSQTSN
ncbi:hypothetical protein NL108_002307 [Boleophthalmus pectinirostris]|nr:hypothetical protein NL108_002307 [Boleophthalmus pectinirostris]